jgi:hypothetical protein
MEIDGYYDPTVLFEQKQRPILQQTPSNKRSIAVTLKLSETAADELTNKEDKDIAYDIILCMMEKFPCCNHSALEKEQDDYIRLTFEGINKIDMSQLNAIVERAPKAVLYDINVTLPDYTVPNGMTIEIVFCKSVIVSKPSKPTIMKLESHNNDNVDGRFTISALEPMRDVLPKSFDRDFQILRVLVRSIYNIERYVPIMELAVDMIEDGRRRELMYCLTFSGLRNISYSFLEFVINTQGLRVWEFDISCESFAKRELRVKVLPFDCTKLKPNKMRTMTQQHVNNNSNGSC